MFHRSSDRLRTLLRWAEDALADPGEAATHERDDFIDHPHRTPLRSRRARRPGTVPAAPAYCVSPVRHVAGYRFVPERAGR